MICPVITINWSSYLSISSKIYRKPRVVSELEIAWFPKSIQSDITHLLVCDFGNWRDYSLISITIRFEQVSEISNQHVRT